MHSDFELADDEDDEHNDDAQQSTSKRSGLTITIKPMVNYVESRLRRSSRNRSSNGSVPQRSGSEFSANNASGSVSGGSESGPKRTNGLPKRNLRGRRVPTAEATEHVDDEPSIYTTRSGRATKVKSYNESSDKETDLFKNDDDVEIVATRRSVKQQILDSDEEEAMEQSSRYETRSRSRRINGDDHGEEEEVHIETTSKRTRRIARRVAKEAQEDDGYVDDPDADADGSTDPEELDDVGPETSDSTGGEAEHDNDGEIEGKTYSFRRRTKQINYAIPPPLEEVRPVKGPARPKGKGRAGPGWSANGTELGRYMGLNGDDSDSDYTRTPRKQYGAGAGGGIFAAGGGGLFPNELASGTPSNLGKVTDAALADADPLGVNPNVTFDEVGGLDDHINSLKEMTLLPLLYPEVFQRFNLTPPRGVLFHGPPGTGKTLLARALASSCRSNGKGISFFMRKGADCLSKWVGEAERQLRLLFDEARNSQPSIIFFDEIDGLAPVRSSKQDQIHASIVSTLLALMDGMDGRGQVIVIGATNRPDAIDPALRRPGRFDREFYFPLPNLVARARILTIITQKWEGWQDEKAKDTIDGLAKITKGYGGADLRALCTEAALNAVQRRYPQIYKSNDRLLLNTQTIFVQPRDFMISVKKLVPSSARSTSSTASPLPPHLVPLLEDAVEQAKLVLDKALPLAKKRSALEEAEWEDDNEDGALEREIMMQSMETLRVYRPRIILHGPSGMGQGYIGAAALHHLEGYHIQSLDLGTLMGDSTRTPEAAIVQQFVEAKRHQPSVLYIPSLGAWCAAVSETTRTTVRALLDSLSPNEPVLLFAILHDAFASLPRDVRSWFGIIRENRIGLQSPLPQKRQLFFIELLKDVRRTPRDFPDGIKRKKRVLEELPVAPPLEPRQLTAAELAVQEDNDQKTIALLKYRLGAILSELKRKFKRFTKRAADEYGGFLYGDEPDPFMIPDAAPAVVHIEPHANGVADGSSLPEDGQMQGMMMERQPNPRLFDIDLERMSSDLFKGKYLTPFEFLDDVGKMVHNAEVRESDDRDRLFRAQAMFTATEVSILEFDPQLKLECERMAPRERERRKQRKEARNKGKRDQAVAPQTNGVATNGPGLRRSARSAGQEPENPITDPLLLERKLKRTRSNDAAAVDCQGSGDENAGDRVMKRPRDEGYADPLDNDELDLMGPTSSQPRRPVVHFADMPDGIPSPSPNRVATHDAVMEYVPDSDPALPPPSIAFGNNVLHPMPFSNMVSPTPNPLQQPFASYAPMPSLFAAMNGSVQGDANDLVTSSVPVDHSVPGIEERLRSLTPRPQFQLLEAAAGAGVSNGDISPTEGSHIPTPMPTAMEVDVVRPPSPTPSPPPIFHVDDLLVTKLTDKLNIDTGKLNVEQLEQLRALCLGCVWRHRQDWDRDEMVRELISLADEFLEEVELDFRDDLL